MLTKDDILNCNDFDLKKETVPEWGGDICIRPMSSFHKLKLRDHLKEKNELDEKGDVIVKNPDGLLERVVAFTVCNEEGSLLFSEEDAVVLAEKNPAVIMRLALIGKEVSGMTETQEELIESEKKS